MYTAAAPAIKPAFRGTQVIWYVLSFLEVTLALRFTLKLFGASPDNWFAGLVYAMTNVLIAPFLYVIRDTRVLERNFEFATLLTMFVLWLIAVGISVMFRAIPGKGK